MPLLTRAQFPEIRSAISISFEGEDGEAMLPDTQIELDLFQGQGERDLLAVVPTAASLIDADPRVRTAAVLFVAARIAPRVPDIVREQFGQYVYQQSPRDFAELAGDLRREAQALVALINGSTDPIEDARPTFFTLASPRRTRPYERRPWGL